MTTDNVYGVIERQLRDENFDVKHLMRDHRGDWGDDGGYIVSVSEKNSKTYLHIIGVDHNVSTSSNVLDENDHRILDGSQKSTDIQDFIICDSIEDAQEKINEFVERLERVVQLVEQNNYFFLHGYVDYEEDVPDGFKNIDKYYLNMLSLCWFPFSENADLDKTSLLNLTNTEYVPDFTSPYDEDQ